MVKDNFFEGRPDTAYQPTSTWEAVSAEPAAFDGPLDVFGQGFGGQPTPWRVKPLEDLGIDPSQFGDTERQRLGEAEAHLETAREIRGLGPTDVVRAMVRGGLPEKRRAQLKIRGDAMHTYGAIIHGIHEELHGVE